MESRFLPFSLDIEEWFKTHQRQGFPWRKEPRDPYAVWISEVMLQQTQVQRVIPFYIRFLEKFPNVQTLAASSWEEFLPYYQGLGYYSRGRNILKTAQIIVEKYNGIFPQTVEELTGLPGIGVYTAHAILSFAFEKPFLSFDTNHRKVWGRFLLGNKKASLDEKNITETLISQKNFSAKILNEALMDFANTVCLNTQPKCLECPVQKNCVYFQQKGSQEVKTGKVKPLFSVKEARVFLFLHRNNQQFFSPIKEKLVPFILTPENNSRHAIQKYFLEKYGLTLSVRPPFQKKIEEGVPTLFVKAQALLGDHEFTVFSKKDFQAYL